ncbi:hypothetical protein LAZ67_15003225 [Cordylochernes scorpioides]|uniref:Uncharacterized protein n=1 Tax=Cordylochernes scorpioides TaxID=51811 RepID=A0ABY6LAE4_9ARAC|nr:hypothetical protein LAZ67_15003225 [Cordylochernes scorpioides]
MISKNGIDPEPNKVDKVINLKKPEDKKSLQRVMGGLVPTVSKTGMDTSEDYSSREFASKFQSRNTIWKGIPQKSTISKTKKWTIRKRGIALLGDLVLRKLRRECSDLIKDISREQTGNERKETDNERSDKTHPGDGNFRTDRRATRGKIHATGNGLPERHPRGNRRPHRRYVSEQPDAHRGVATRHAVPVHPEASHATRAQCTDNAVHSNGSSTND